ncbi:reverse transcriptase, partial [Phytophthora megakarya]
MVPAGVRMDLADGSVRLPDEVGTPLNCRKRLYGEKVRSVILERSLRIPVGQSEEIAAKIKLASTEKLWVTRVERWVRTVTEGPGRIRYLVTSNVGEEILRLDHRLDIESRSRARIADANQIEAEFLDPERGRPSTPTTSPDGDRYLSGNAEGVGISESMPDEATDRTDTNDAKTENQTDVGNTEPRTGNLNCQTQIKLDTGEVSGVKSPIHPTEVVDLRDSLAEGEAATTPQDTEDEDGIYSHESDDLSAEDLEGNLAVLPEIPISTTAKVSIEDLQACDKWNLSIRVAKSLSGMDKVVYLGHRVSIGGLEANPKNLKSLTDLPFPGSLRSMQSFLGSLNYCSRFNEDYAIYASVLYELREVEFAEVEKRSDLREIMDRNDPIPQDLGPPELKLTEPVDERWIRAHRAFTALKTKIATTPILLHFDETRMPVVIVYASDWAISASLAQEHDGIYHPVAFASRTLKTNGLNYNVTEKEVLALLMVRPPGPVDARDHEVHEGRGRNTGGNRCQHHSEGEDGRSSDRNRSPEGT